VLLLLCAWLSLPGETRSEQVYLPVTLDYQFLRSLIIQTAYSGPGGTAKVFNVDNGCQEITLTDPTYTARGSHIHFETKIIARAGIYTDTACTNPIEWEGFLKVTQKPKLSKTGWTLSFDIIDSVLVDTHHKKTDPPPVIKELIDTWAYGYIAHMSVNLMPPVAKIKVLMRELFPPDLCFLAEKMIRSMTPGHVTAEPDALRFYIALDTNAIHKENEDIRNTLAAMKEEELTEDTWRAWDAFLVYIIDVIIREPLSDDDRQVLLDTLLDARYSFLTALSEGTFTKDFVRHEFTTAWEQLAPVFRNNLGDTPSPDLMSYLAFITAADALTALDQIMADLGLELNKRSLVFLARLLSRGTPINLDYTHEVDDTLQHILKFTPSGDDGSAPLPLPGSSRFDCVPAFASTLAFLLPATAWAVEESEENDPEDWILKKSDMDTYAEKIRKLLTTISRTAIEHSSMPTQYHEFYRTIVLATAWQESCLRQFQVNNGEVLYLRSYNDTSVGLMQINEIVWRGFYDPHQLRWDIAYNAAAGCRILDLYLCRYTLRRMKKMNMEDQIDKDTVARLVYAMYNGGPGQFYKFLKRQRKERYYLSDKLFWDKYIWVRDGEWHNLRKCLIGG